MLRFFRQIRQRLFTENKFSKYLLYAVGEILLVVIGILIALQVDDWANKKELKAAEKQTYAVLLTSLRKDSLELVRIIDVQTKSLNAQNTILNSNAKELLDKHSNREISELILDVYNGAYSFFPKYGTYNSLVSNKGIDLISSEKIKSDLIDLYDYWCPRYENVDEVSDKKFHNLLIPFLQREIGFFVTSDFEITVIDPVRFEEAYTELQLQCGNVNYLTTNSIGGLKNIQKRVNWLIEEIESQRSK
ncbi:DUF6090 family protein [Robiginitalea sp. IMCC44478]|uniref:DUF6090 family protein n=1 Tax=Robiginitalea sp. IMCC44478 TaxID=3459122 RepID=UPI0040438A42